MAVSMFGERVELRSEVEIAAPLHMVWDVVTNFRAYREWNPLIVEAEGDLAEGAIVSTTVSKPDKSEQKIRRRILKLEPQTELRWTATQLVRALAHDEQFFKFVAVDNNRVRLLIGENVSGIFAPRTPSELSRLSQALNLLNQAIKRRAQSINVSVS
jgi:hypothetical protein